MDGETDINVSRAGGSRDSLTKKHTTAANRGVSYFCFVPDQKDRPIMSIKVDSDNTLSLTKILALRGEGFATIRRDSAEIALLANHLELLDVALQSNADCRSIDEQQHLVDAARLVAGLLDGSAAAR